MNVQPDLFGSPIITAVASYSGGVASWAAAKRWAEQHGTRGLVLLFADVLMEDPTSYRFLIQGAANIFGVPEDCSSQAIDLPWLDKPNERLAALDALFDRAATQIPGLVRFRDGRTPFQVFRDEKFIGNSSSDPCSKILKRQMIDAWVSHYAPDSVAIIGLDWTEQNRFDRFKERVRNAAAPLMDKPTLDKAAVIQWAQREGLDLPRLYDLGFQHGNCSGMCCKAGQGHWALTLKVLPDVFAFAERQEAILRDQVGDHSMLKDRTGGVVKSLPLSELRRRIEAGQVVDKYDIGGCGCAVE